MSEERPKPQTNYLNMPASAQPMADRPAVPGTNLLSTAWKITFRFGSQTAEVPVSDIIVIGRATDDDSPVQLDLNPFGGYQGGVSRRHAQITLQEGAVYIEDLGSTNGTRINGFQLVAHRKYRLRDGDEVELARVRSSVKFTRGG